MIVVFKQYLFVSVPRNADQFRIGKDNFLYFYSGIQRFICLNTFGKKIKWNVVGKASNLLEKDWECIIDEVDDFYFKMYAPLENNWAFTETLKKAGKSGSFKNVATSSPITSGVSLLKSLNLSPETTFVLKNIG